MMMMMMPLTNAQMRIYKEIRQIQIKDTNICSHEDDEDDWEDKGGCKEAHVEACKIFKLYMNINQLVNRCCL